MLVFHKLPEGVHPEPVYAPLQPEAQNVHHRLPDLGIAPVEVGMLPEVGVIVVLLRLLIPLPGSTAEGALPVVGGSSIVSRVLPDVPVASGVLARGARLDEPGVLVRSVVR